MKKNNIIETKPHTQRRSVVTMIFFQEDYKRHVKVQATDHKKSRMNLTNYNINKCNSIHIILWIQSSRHIFSHIKKQNFNSQLWNKGYTIKSAIAVIVWSARHMWIQTNMDSLILMYNGRRSEMCETSTADATITQKQIHT